MKQFVKKIRARSRAVLLFVFMLSVTGLFFFASDASALHRYHTSLTRMDFNEREKLLEISIQLFTHDLIPVLEQRAKKQIDLEKTPEVDQLILAYLNENFVLRDKTGVVKKLNWVGKEIDVDAIWIYVEIPFSESPENASLQNTIFFETFPEQTNLVVARFVGKKADLLFRAGDKYKEIKENSQK